MDWTQFAIFMMTMAGMFMWSISMINAIQIEIKDFHGRLCTLEEKYRQIK
jgi:hypothetical protein